MNEKNRMLEKNSDQARQTPEPLTDLPTASEFEELLSRDTPNQSASCINNYSVYHRYSRSC